MYTRNHLKKFRSERFKLANDGLNRVERRNQTHITKGMTDTDLTHITYLHPTKGYKRVNKKRILKQAAIEAIRRGSGDYVVTGVKNV
jgi:hypothetical protein